MKAVAQTTEANSICIAPGISKSLLKENGSTVSLSFITLFFLPIFNPMSGSDRSSRNTTRKLNLQDDIPAEIKRNILRSLETTRDVKNLSETSVGFNLEAKRLQFRMLNLGRLFEYPNELGKMRSMNELIEQLSKTAVKGDHPLSFYVRTIKLDPEDTRRLPDNSMRCAARPAQVEAILKACDQLHVIDFLGPIKNIDWPGILRTKKKLQCLDLFRWSSNEEQHSFWPLLNALTTTSPDICYIGLGPRLNKDERGYPDAATIERAARAGRPCRKLKAVKVMAEVWTIPLLKYLTIMAPNLVHVVLFLKYEKNLNELKSTLEACLKKWSETLMVINIAYLHNHEKSVPGHSLLQLLPLTFPNMERLERLMLSGVQISSASLYSLKLLTSLCLFSIDHTDIVDTLYRPSVLQRLTCLTVDKAYIYEDVVARRKGVKLYSS